MERRIALLSDIHGNATALEAVLRDAAARDATDYWHLGDVIGPGPGFPDIARLLADVGTDVYVRGNWDDAIEEVCQGEVDLDDPNNVYATVIVAWLLDRLAPAQADAVAAWPLAQTRLVNGLTIAAWHNLADQNYGRGLLAAAPQEDLADLCGDADIVVFGHWHEQVLRWTQRRQMLVNPGSVGQAWMSRPGATAPAPAEYALLRVAADGVADVAFRCVPYDHAAEAERARAADLPYLELYEEQLATGTTFQHNHGRLALIERRHGYRELAERFLASVTRSRQNLDGAAVGQA